MSQFILAAASGSLTKKKKGAFCGDDKTYLSYKVVCVCFVSASPSVTWIKIEKRLSWCIFYLKFLPFFCLLVLEMFFSSLMLCFVVIKASLFWATQDLNTTLDYWLLCLIKICYQSNSIGVKFPAPSVSPPAKRQNVFWDDSLRSRCRHKSQIFW